MEQVWDRWVRFTHWMVVLLVLGNLFNDSGTIWHRYAGYAAAGLVAARWLWAGLSRGYASFDAWWPRLAACVGYLRALKAAGLSGQPPRYVGHNPIGACMAVLLWGLIVALGVTGWMMRLDLFWGDEWLQNVHAGLADVLRVAIVIHVAGVVAMSYWLRENLISVMITGKKYAQWTDSKS
jgi:cytochrome b